MRVTLRTDGTIQGLALGPTFAILHALAGTPSLLAAARGLGISYRSAWSRLGAIEAALGRRVVVKTKGHGTVLTPYGQALHASLAGTVERLGPVLAAEEARLADALRSLGVPEPRRLRLAASHDPLLLDAVAAIPGVELNVAGSLDALALLRAGGVDAAGYHFGARSPAPAPFDALFREPGIVIYPLFDREQGFMLPPGNPHGVTSVADIARQRLRFVNRQRGAGTRIWFERLCAEAGLSREAIPGSGTEEFTHQAVAALIATGSADVGMGTPGVAERFGLAFHSVGWETYFLAVRTDRVAPTQIERHDSNSAGNSIPYDTLTHLLAAIRRAAGATRGYAVPAPAYHSAACG